MDIRRESIQAAIAIVGMDSETHLKKPTTVAADVVEVAAMVERYFEFGLRAPGIYSGTHKD